MSPLAALVASLKTYRDALQSAPPDAVRFTNIVYRHLADSDIFAQTIHQLTSRDIQVTSILQATKRSSVMTSGGADVPHLLLAPVPLEPVKAKPIPDAIAADVQDASCDEATALRCKGEGDAAACSGDRQRAAGLYSSETIRELVHVRVCTTDHIASSN
jgi:hypothetical protein